MNTKITDKDRRLDSSESFLWVEQPGFGTHGT
jgi:hypothetical protein